MVTHGIHACWLDSGSNNNPSLTITNCEIYDNKGTGSSCGCGGNGIFVYAGGPESKDEYIIIRNNTLYNNDKSGFWAKMMLSESSIENNEFYNNGNGPNVQYDVTGGLVLRCMLSSKNYLINNLIYDNYGDGIYIGGSENVAEKNILKDNSEHGIHLGRSDGSLDNQINNNYICGHTGIYYDVKNFHSSGGGNSGNNNAGLTAHNYYDEGNSGSTYFTYHCSPDTIITSGPSETIDYHNVSFSWTGGGYVKPSYGLKYSYKLQGYDSSWSSYTHSTYKSYNDLEDGSYTFKVRSKDAAGNVDTSPAQKSFTVQVDTATQEDITPPTTIITSGPSAIIDYNNVSFSWAGSDDITPPNELVFSHVLEGTLDSWSDWSSSKSTDYNNLDNGEYIFKVKAKDAAGNIDQNPAERSFTVEVDTATQEDITPPTTIITSGPSGIIDYNNVSFSWAGSDDITPPNELVFSHVLEGTLDSWSDWSSSKSTDYNNLDNGEYIFKVKAKDAAGNIDQNPAERSFTVEIKEEPKLNDETLIVTSDYTFTENMLVSFGHGIIIGANNITIDGNGFVLDGDEPRSCSGGVVDRFGIYNIGFDNVTIRNLEIRNFCSGIFLSYDHSNGKIVYGNVIDNCRIHNNGNDDVEWTESHGIKLIGVSDSIIKNCIVYENKGSGDGCEDGGNGIFIMGTSSGDGGKRNRVTNNEIFNNSKGGFFTKMKPEFTFVDNNTIYGNGQGGIILRCMLSNIHTIENNEIYNNYGSGIFIGGNDNVIRNNIISSNKNGSKYTGVVGRYGVGVNFGRNDGSKNNSLFNNMICGNDMVDVEAFDSNKRTGNHGFGNTGDTAINYKDDEAIGYNYFTYSCSQEAVKSEPIVKQNEDTNTPGFELLIFFGAILFLHILKTRKKGEKNL